MTAYAVLNDPALELRFSTPVWPERMLLERLGLILIVQTICALSFQWFALALKADLALLGNWIDVQMAWLIELLARGWLARNASKYVLVFMPVLMPEHPVLMANRICLLTLSAGLLVASWALLRRQERYI